MVNCADVEESIFGHCRNRNLYNTFSKLHYDRLANHLKLWVFLRNRYIKLLRAKSVQDYALSNILLQDTDTRK